MATVLTAFSSLAAPALARVNRAPTPAAVPRELIVIVRAGEEISPASRSTRRGDALSPGIFERVVSRDRITPQPMFRAHSPRDRRAQGTPPVSAYRLVLPVGRDLATVAAELRRDPRIASVEPNFLFRGQGEREPPTNDPFVGSAGSWGQDFADLWGVYRVGAPPVWDTSRGEGVVVAVVDSGLDIEHPDITRNVWRNPLEIDGNGIDDDGNGYVDDLHGWDFTRCARSLPDGSCTATKSDGPLVGDGVGHGTHVTGIIAAVADNFIGIAGVAPDAQVMPLQALDLSGSGTAADIATAVVYAAENGARVLNASFSGPPSEVVRLAIDYAAAHDVVVLAAAGNDHAPLERGVSPAGLTNVLAVGSIQQTDETSPFSNFGGALDLVAPGGGDGGSGTRPDLSILSLLASGSLWSDDCTEVCDDEPPFECHEECRTPPWVIDERYVRAAGTSMSAAFATGVAALIRASDPTLDRAQVEQILLESAGDLGAPGWDPHSGYGVVDAAGAMKVDTPIARLIAPDNGTKIWERDFPFTVQGNVDGRGAPFEWRLYIRLEGSDEKTEIGRGSTSLHGQQLAQLAPPRAGIEPGERSVLRLEVTTATGLNASDERTFLYTDPKFGLIPLPSLAGEATGFFSMSADGNGIAFERFPIGAVDGRVMLFDVSTRELRQVAYGTFPHLSPDGRALMYSGTMPTGERRNAILYDVGANAYRGFPDFVHSGPLDNRGGLVFTSAGNPLRTNDDDSYELFSFDVPSFVLTQATDGPLDPFHQPEVDQLAASVDQGVIAFTSRTSFDPQATTGGLPQIFVRDHDAIRQITGRQGTPSSGLAPTLSAGGNLLVYQESGLYAADLSRGTHEQVIGEGSGVPQLADDGNFLFFYSVGDLDPAVGNEDFSSEVFALDLRTREVSQVTDTLNSPAIAAPAAASASARLAVVVDALRLNSIGLSLQSARIVPRRLGDTAPSLDLPAELSVPEGRHSCLPLRAFDRESDAITFHVEREPADQGPLYELGGSELSDHGDGTAELCLRPGARQSGTYPLRVGAFDEGGAVGVTSTRLVVDDTLVEGDADCSGAVDAADIERSIDAIFDARIAAECELVDHNEDGGVNAADLLLPR